MDKDKADPINLAPEALRHFIMGTDSFTVVREVAVAGQPTTMPFGEADVYRVVLKGKFQVLEHDRLVPGRYGPGQYGGPAHYRTWVLRPTKEADLVIMPTENQEFAQHAAAFLSTTPRWPSTFGRGWWAPPTLSASCIPMFFAKKLTR